MAGGRPSKYKPEFCKRVIELGKQGMGVCEMAAEIDISWDSFDTYRQEYPEFSGAVKEALRRSQAWWESNGRIATFGGCKDFNATSYIFQMKNRFKEDWREKTETEHSGGVTVEILRLGDAE